jgi:hypothetical protein
VTPAPRGGRRIAVMQPYFFPYAGYFRLLAGVDEFVVYDCVQFPRRGRVHRCELPPAAGHDAGWLTLPLARQPRETTIADLRFADGARAEFDRRLDALPWLAAAGGPAADRVRTFLRAPLDDVVDTLEAGLRLVGGLLGLAPAITRSSSLALPSSLRGQDRILEICRRRGAAAYLNAPGGRALYDAGVFAQAGIALEFLPDYAGPHRFLLPALVSLPPEVLRADVLSSTRSPGAA